MVPGLAAFVAALQKEALPEGLLEVFEVSVVPVEVLYRAAVWRSLPYRVVLMVRLCLSRQRRLSSALKPYSIPFLTTLLDFVKYVKGRVVHLCSL